MRYIGFIMMLALGGCPKAEFGKPQFQQTASAEDIVQSLLESHAKESEQCSAEKLNLVRNEASIKATRDFVGGIKNLKLTEVGPAQLNLEPLKSFAGGISPDNKVAFGFAVLGSEQFRELLIDVADNLEKLAADRLFTDNVDKIEKKLSQDQKLHDKLSYVLDILADNLGHFEALCGAAKAVMCDKDLGRSVLDVLYAPTPIWQKGGPKFAGDGLALYEEFKEPGNLIFKSVEELSFERSQEIRGAFLQSLAGGSGEKFCAMETIQPLCRHLPQLAGFLKVPKKGFVDLLYHLYTMQTANGCVGAGVDSLEGQQIAEELRNIASFIKDKEKGLVYLQNKLRTMLESQK
ncbi:MAG: hypothetical protein JKY15_00635 [Deltaproteobacteria bacterium]|nr:hypothetical protein [Deltaproteobacteria bacterium]